jgi:hypothetical protein
VQILQVSYVFVWCTPGMHAVLSQNFDAVLDLNSCG